MDLVPVQLHAPQCVIQPFEQVLIAPKLPDKAMQLIAELRALLDDRAELAALIAATPDGEEREQMLNDLGRLDLEIALARQAMPVGVCPKDME